MDDYGNSIALTMLAQRQDRLENRLEEVEERTEAIPALISSNKAVIRALYTAGGSILVAAVLVVLFGGGPT